MKKLLTLILLLSAAVSHAQTTTNVIAKITAEIVTAGVTNSSSTSFNVVPATSQKDGARINGWSWVYMAARAGGYTNTFDVWLAKVWVKDNSDVTANAYLQSISVDTLNKLNALMVLGGLSPADLSTVTTIANKNAVP